VTRSPRRRSTSAELIGALVGGIVVGAVATLYHAAWYPWGLGAAVSLVSLFVVALRVIAPTRVPAIAGALGFVGVITVFAGVDSQGSVLIVADTPGLLFLGLVTAVTVVALAWPKLSPRPTRYDKEAGFVERTPPQ
jgi:hypothetical protein